MTMLNNRTTTGGSDTTSSYSLEEMIRYGSKNRIIALGIRQQLIHAPIHSTKQQRLLSNGKQNKDQLNASIIPNTIKFTNNNSQQVESLGVR